MFRTPEQTPGLQYGLAAILSIAPTIFTALRFRVRIVKKVELAMDDWLIVFALVSSQQACEVPCRLNGNLGVRIHYRNPLDHR